MPGNPFVNFSLTKEHKLLNSLDFSQVFEKSDFKVSTSSSLILVKLTTNCYPRLGLVISKKNVGCAVARNRIKRLCRETFRLRSAQLPKMDVVVLAKNGISRLDNKKVVEMLNGLFDQVSAKIEYNKRS